MYSSSLLYIAFIVLFSRQLRQKIYGSDIIRFRKVRSLTHIINKFDVYCFLHKQNALWITLPQKFHMKHFLKQVIHNDRRE